MDTKKTVNFIFELNQLKRQHRNGFILAGVKNPDTVAEHALRAAQIGYILAVMEGNANPDKVATMLIIHDNAATRIGDQNKVSARYFSNKDAKQNAWKEQLENLQNEVREKWLMYLSEYENRTTQESIIARDADWLETAFQAKEYFDLGYESTVDFIDNVEKALETESAKKIIKEMKNTKFTDWWKGLKKMTYEKLN
jgi:putative hydrolase of HD superfamily